MHLDGRHALSSDPYPVGGRGAQVYLPIGQVRPAVVDPHVDAPLVADREFRAHRDGAVRRGEGARIEAFPAGREVPREAGAVSAGDGGTRRSRPGEHGGAKERGKEQGE